MRGHSFFVLEYIQYGSSIIRKIMRNMMFQSDKLLSSASLEPQPLPVYKKSSI
jgi:hypothetical protein